MDKLKKNIFIYILLVINFYILPALIKDTGTAMIMLLVVIPMITLFISIYYGKKNDFDIWYVISVGILFSPSIFIFYNSSALIYVIVYTIIALIGNFVGK
ncbi:MAG: hypothetical protein SOU06_05575 [Bulleidia sp.]|nr:hypothetical protein [Erysipelotrichaceae bacterium]MDY2780990.1 hypothetical protein [Bulleidia sp.]